MERIGRVELHSAQLGRLASHLGLTRIIQLHTMQESQPANRAPTGAKLDQLYQRVPRLCVHVYKNLLHSIYYSKLVAACQLLFKKILKLCELICILRLFDFSFQLALTSVASLQNLVPPERIELPSSDYKTDVLPFNYRGIFNCGAGEETRTPKPFGIGF